MKIAKATGVIRWYMLRMGYLGWTSFWNTVYVLELPAFEALLRHEGKHLEQIKRMGRIKFTVVYLWYWVKYGYKDNPLEVEAREAEKDVL